MICAHRDTRRGLTGYERDDESSLDFAQARYYNPTHGRFTSVDPLTASATIRNPQTFNRYTYVLNSPYNFTDPLGLIPETTGACGNRCRNSDGGALGFIGLYSDKGSTIVIADEQQAESPTPPPVPGLLVQQNTTTFTASQITDGILTEVTFTVTENVYLVCDECTGFDDLTVHSETTVVAKNGPNAQFKLDEPSLSLAANVVGEVIAEATAQGLDDPAVALGIAQKESFFGTVPGGQIPEMQSHINPMKLTRNQFLDGTQPSATDMAHNVKHAIRLFVTDKMAGGRTLAQGLFRYGPGNAQDPDYVSKTMGNIKRISDGRSTTSTNPFTVHMVTLDR